MSQVSQAFYDKIERWMLGGLDINRMSMSDDQKYRAMVVYEAYHEWLTNKQIVPTRVMRNISARNYPVLLQKARSGDERAMAMVKAMNIREGVQRTPTEISNDVAALNWFIGRFDVDTTNIEKAKVLDASDWLISEGQKMGNITAVAAGANLKMKMNNDFKEDKNEADKMPLMEINITGDVSVIKRDRVNYTDEERKRIARKYGLSEKQVINMIQDSNGTWQMPSEEGDKTKEKDIYELNDDMEDL